MSVGTIQKIKRFAVDYKGKRTFVNTTDTQKAMAFAYSNELRGQERERKLYEEYATPEMKPFETNPDLASLVTFKAKAIAKESLRY